jgi:cell wall-associated NlpC family hydrolase
VIITKSAGSAVVGQSITFDASGSRDPEGGPLTFLWSFFDLDIEKSGPIVSQSYPTPGTKTVGLTVTDNQGAKTISSAVIVVTSPQSGVKTQVTTQVTTLVANITTTPITTLATNTTTTQRPSNITSETTTIAPTEVVTGVTQQGTSGLAPVLTAGTAVKSSGDAGAGSGQAPAQNPAGAAAGGSPVNIYVVLGVMAIILVGIFGFIMFKRQ